MSFKFSQEQKKRLIDELEIHKFDESDIEEFIACIEVLCELRIRIPTTSVRKEILDRKQIPNISDLRELREKILSNLKQSEEYLKQLASAENPLFVLSTVEPTHADDDLEDSLISHLMAKRALKPIQDVIKAIEEMRNLRPRNRGRPKADATEFVRCLADYFSLCLQTHPTQEEAGPFYGVITTVFEFLGLPIKDPSRQIKAGIRSRLY